MQISEQSTNKWIGSYTNLIHHKTGTTKSIVILWFYQPIFPPAFFFSSCIGLRPTFTIHLSRRSVSAVENLNILIAEPFDDLFAHIVPNTRKALFDTAEHTIDYPKQPLQFNETTFEFLFCLTRVVHAHVIFSFRNRAIKVVANRSISF